MYLFEEMDQIVLTGLDYSGRIEQVPLGLDLKTKNNLSQKKKKLKTTISQQITMLNRQMHRHSHKMCIRSKHKCLQKEKENDLKSHEF